METKAPPISDFENGSMTSLEAFPPLPITLKTKIKGD